MPHVSLSKLYVACIEKLDIQRNELTHHDFESFTPKPAFFILLLHATLENFLAISFRKHIINIDMNDDAKENLKGKLGNFSFKDDYPLFCSILFPEIYENLEIRKIFINKRNAYAHRIINQNGDFIFEKDEKNFLSKDDIDSYLLFAKKIMLTVKEKIEELELST